MSPIMGKPVDVVNQRHAAAAGDVLELVHGVMHLYRAQQLQALRHGDQGVTHMESKVLGFFARHPGGTQSELVAHSGRDKSQLARLIGGLRERGLLDAQVDADDRRSVRLHLTPQGQAANEALRRQARKLSTVAVKGMTEPERAQLTMLLERVRANLEAGH